MTASNDSVSHWVSSLSLSPHPEGGYFKETYRSSDSIPAGTFGDRFSGSRSVSTGIFYLLEAGDFSAFHRIRSDEMWHFYAGGSLELHVLHDGKHQVVRIGRDVQRGEHLQFVVPAGAWFASTPVEGASYSLLGCTVSPGFDFNDFEMASRSALIATFPLHGEVVTRFKR